MNTKYYVIAGNHQQGTQFIKNKCGTMVRSGWTSMSLSNFVYVASPEILRGQDNPTGWFYGSWRERDDIGMILMMLVLNKKKIQQHYTPEFRDILKEFGFKL